VIDAQHGKRSKAALRRDSSERGFVTEHPP